LWLTFSSADEDRRSFANEQEGSCGDEG
jgi:hypothetical protein